MRVGNVQGNTVDIKRGLLKSQRRASTVPTKRVGEFGPSMYEYGSGTNSVEKQTSGLNSYIAITGKSPKIAKEEQEKEGMAKDLNDVAKTELVRYRTALVRKTKNKKRKKKNTRTVSKRLLKYKNPVPASVKSDIKREKNIQGDDDISPII